MAADGEVQPNLATSWEVSDDGLTYTFTLTDSEQFHDGSALDADDVLFSFNRAMAEDSVNPSKGIFKPIESVTAMDARTIEIALKNKDAYSCATWGRATAPSWRPRRSAPTL